MEIDADAFAAGGYVGRGMHASLAYQGFGSLDSSTTEGAIARSMFGLEVTMDHEIVITSDVASCTCMNCAL